MQDVYKRQAAVEGLIDYDKTVQFPFGYGLSYTDFEQKMGDVTVADGKVSFDVTVTNNGTAAGKDVVEVYYNPPYTNGEMCIRDRSVTVNSHNFSNT